MENRIKNIKQGVYKVALCSALIFLVSMLLTGVFITLLVITLSQKISWLWLGLVVFSSLIAIFSLIATICGLIFLKSNKNWIEIQKVTKKSFLDWGLFYFVYSNKIDKFSEKKEQKAEEQK
ncbi:hypothetical protein [Spiroplasma cantharicola]|uniref:Uncharacterized protein n=1 Tax=Spiroplasma cantharicola TaxID=362837 RepID=A0A0M5KLK1_9MOLU|nr:hypothetical protein [Spiroplasma cantharicola]ALD66463.1 hypothetical protein SCANT_v1c05570 [Spiroplasma cantharicola]